MLSTCYDVNFGVWKDYVKRYFNDRQSSRSITKHDLYEPNNYKRPRKKKFCFPEKKLCSLSTY